MKTTVGAATSGTVATAGFVAGLASGNAERKNDEDANLNKFDTDNESEKILKIQIMRHKTNRMTLK